MPTGKALLDPHALLKRAGLENSDHYADFGCGALGHFVFPASEIVGEDGRVYAVDVVREALEELEQRIRHEVVHNIIPVWGDIEVDNGIQIDPESIDLVSLVNMAVHTKMRANCYQEARRVLKVGGRLLVADWRPGAGSIVIKEEDRVAREVVRGEVSPLGFRLIEEFDAGPQHWGLLFERIA